MTMEIRVQEARRIEGVQMVATMEQVAVSRNTDFPVIFEEDDWEIAQIWESHKNSEKRKKEVERVNTFTAQNCYVLGPSMIVLTSSGYIIKETVQKFKMLNSLETSLGTSLRDLQETMRGTPFEIPSLPSAAAQIHRGTILSSAIFDNFYHWTLEVIPRLSLISDEISSNRIVITPPLRKAFHGQSLQCFSTSTEDLNTIQVNDVLYCRELTFSTATALSNTVIAPFVRDFFSSHSASSKHCGKKIYISRSKAKTRRVTNEKEIEIWLSQMGIEIVILEELDVAEQISLFKSASLVIAPHGAGLANLVHSPKGTTVIELTHNMFDQGLTSFWAISNLFEHDYRLVIGKASRNAVPHNANRDFSVPIKLLQQALENLSLPEQPHLTGPS